jgi:SAM-dependent methyltransferase
LNPNNLPNVGIISNTDKDFFGYFSDLKGKNILCIGFSSQEIEWYVEKYQPASIKVLTKWADHVDAAIERFPIEIGDITKKTIFKENTFDAILTLSVLEHLDDLEGAFNEMIRICKDGGEMIHMFGPSWTSAYGHHVYINDEDPLLNFSLWNMPAHMHLLCSPEEIAQYYMDMGYSEEVGNNINHWFFDTPIINRRPYDDYINIFNSKSLQVDRMEIMYNKLPISHINALKNIYPDLNDFSSYGGKYKIIINKN